MSLVALPDDAYRPRVHDPRVGFFGISFHDFAQPVQRPLQQQWVSRHRLMRGPDGTIANPIVYYIDPGIPEPVRTATMQGVKWWEDAFAKAGLPGGFRVEMLPAGVDPMDVRYNVVQWENRNERGWSVGGSLGDPRTGEILKAMARMDCHRARTDYNLYAGLKGADAAAADTAFILARVRQVSAHEVGHTLGLGHNYIASTYERGSVMDYPAPRVRLDARGEIDLSQAYAVGPGDYDVWAIRWGYGIFPQAAEADSLRAIVREGLGKGYLYLSDTDARPEYASDPRTNLWDDAGSSEDFWRHQTAVRKVAMARFGERAIRPGDPLALLQERFAPVYFMHRFAMNGLSKSIGGLEYTNALRGDGQQATRPVSADRQRRALALLLQGLQPAMLAIPDTVVTLLGPRRERDHAAGRAVRHAHASRVRRAGRRAHARADDRRRAAAARPRRARRAAVAPRRRAAAPGRGHRRAAGGDASDRDGRCTECRAAARRAPRRRRSAADARGRCRRVAGRARDGRSAARRSGGRGPASARDERGERDRRGGRGARALALRRRRRHALADAPRAARADAGARAAAGRPVRRGAVSASRVTLDGILRARSVIDPRFLDSPQRAFAGLDEALGARVVLKIETLNPVRSFKGRGADCYVAARVQEAGARGEGPPRLVCASAGNFGQGIAHAARARGASAVVYASASANALKVARMRALGAEVRIAGADFDAAKDAARAAADAEGVPFVEDGRELAVTEGAGTMGLELAEWPDPIDLALIPLGNGALLAGVGHALRARSPSTRIVAVCAAGAPAMARSLRERRVVETARVDTIADGIAVRVPVPEALDDLRGIVDDVVLVDDRSIVAAMRLVHEHAGLVVEPAGAVGVAAMLAHPDLVRGTCVATPLCGSNLTPAQLADWL